MSQLRKHPARRASREFGRSLAQLAVGMGEVIHDRSPHTLLNGSGTDEQMTEQRSISDEWLRKDRSDTDESLQEERSAADDLLENRHDEQRLVEVVHESRTDAERVLLEVRADSDVQLEQKAEALPEISEKLERVADTLSEAAASLTGAAAVLQKSTS